MGICLRVLTGSFAIAACRGSGDGVEGDTVVGETGSESTSITSTSSTDGAGGSEGSGDETDTGLDMGSAVEGWIAIDAGNHITCGLRADASLWCWGSNTQSMIVGNSDDEEILVPMPILTDAVPDSIIVGRTSACLIDEDAAAWCWGSNAASELGLGDDVPRTEPTRVEPAGFVRLSLGTCGCGVRTDASLWCWGWPESGLTSTPTALDRSPVWANVAHGYQEIAAVREDGSLWWWSAGDPPAAFGPDRAWSSAPGALTVSAYSGHACAIASDASLWCWGTDGHGQLGNGAAVPSPADPDPVLVLGDSSWRAVSAGDSYTCAIDIEDAVWCWGRNEHGQLGNGEIGGDVDPSTADRDAPVSVLGERAWLQVAAGRDHACAIDTEHEAWCWGRNYAGSLGTGDLDERLEPTLVLGP